MKITEEQKERANLVNLPQFLMSHGFDLKRAGREYIWKDHDSLHIRDNGPGERGQWFRFSENKGGDNIGFLREYMGMSFADAVEALTGETIDRTYTPPSRTYEHKPPTAARELTLAEADNARRVFAYLCRTRGLDYDLVSALVRDGRIAQEEKTGNVLFKYYDDNGKVIGAEKVGTSTEHKFKGIATGSAGGHGFEVVRGTGENAFFFESAIDMLSYLQMHDKELSDCRLVSMMGVKPNIVLDTMLRSNISPDKVFLCSDNDTAGNDFAERLTEQYPEMKHIKTPDIYKDWNDMLRDIPKEQETNKEAGQINMQYYGNEMWNRATDNRDKSLVTVSVHDFPKLKEQLEQAGMNYYGYVRGDSVVMAVNDSDVEWFGRVSGAPDIAPEKSNRPYSPPEKNIIGNAEYRYIPNKEYFSSDRDMVLKMAEVMAERGIRFSGRVYTSGKGTLTVSRADIETVRAIRNETAARRSQHEAPGKNDVRDNNNSYLYMTKLTTAQFNDMRMYLETSVNYHTVIRDGKVAFTLDRNDAPAFHRAFENVERELGLLHSMANTGLSLEQLAALSPVMHRLAVEDVKLDLTSFFDERYDDAQFGEMLSLVDAYLAQSPAERYGENSRLNAMLEAKSNFDRAIELDDFFSGHDFTEEQKAAITAMFVGDVTRGQIDSIDESFTAEDIQAYDEILHTALQESDVAEFLAAHRQAVIEREKAAKEASEPEKPAYKIYQLKGGEKYHDIRFRSMERLKAEGTELNQDDYDLVYKGEIEEFNGNATLEAIYTKFNIDHPEDFRGHSLSVSDVIVITDNGKDTAYYCDSFGFTGMPEFFREKVLTQEKEEDPLFRAKNLINDFCVDEYSEEADFSDLHNIGLAHTTLTDDDFPVQVTADLADFKITYEFDGEVYNTEQYGSIGEMIEKGLTGLDFSDLVSVPDEVIERHTAKDEQDVTLMSDASEMEEASIPDDDYKAITLNYKGDAESLAEIKDKALSLGASVLVDNAEGTISVDTYENHKTELDTLAYTLGLTSITEFTSAIDEPLFTDADVIEDIQRNEDSDVPFREKPDTAGEQLSLFGDAVPLTASKTTKEKSKSEFAPGPIVDGVNVFVALAAEIERGTGFVHGKFRVQDFYEKSRTQPNHPTTQELAAFLKKEYGTGGHSGNGNISLVDYDSKGLTFSFENGEKFRHSWFNVAAMVEQHLRDNAYLSINEKEMWQEIKAERAAEENAEPYRIEIGDRFRNKATGIISEVVALTGALPYYTEDCTVKRLSGSFEITENLSYDYLLNSGLFEYIGKGEPETEKAETEIPPVQEADVSGENKTVSEENLTPDKGENFTITDDTLGEGGAKTKFRANADAIRTLKTLEAEKHPATAAEKETLSKYVGWGAIPQAFDQDAEKWSSEYRELSELLTPEEYRQARSTVNDAFYTSPVVIDSIYEALRSFGFDGGNVLEPAMGIGNFFGCMPKGIQDNSHLYGIEIDSISGRIAKALYPDADIAITGFEKNNFQNGCFDVAVGNVPFGELGFKDTVHNTTKLHDFFFAEALDKLKDGGIMAFVTSAGTLDKRDESTRQMLADKADFIGAVRLPGGKNGAFRDNAGTEVTTDIIFLKKHEGKSVSEMSDIPDWVHIGKTDDGLPVNKYFEQHPEMVLGKIIEGNKLYGSGTMVVADDDFDLRSALHEALGKLSAEISHDRGREVYARTSEGEKVEIPSNLRDYSLFLSEDKVYFKKHNSACEYRFDKTTAQHKRFTAFIEMRDLTRELLEAQELDKPNSVIKELQTKLGEVYDDFYKKYGLIHSQTNKRYFSEDVSYNLVAGLEKSYDKNKLKEKSDIFFRRTIVPPKAVEHVDTALEALTLSVSEKAKIDFEYMSRLTGMTEEELKHDLTGEIFRVPHTENEYQTASEYLSGDIRKKLRAAEEIAEYDADFNINVAALKKAMPEPLKAGDIDVKIGATWIDPKYYDQFIYELLQTPAYQRSTSPSARWNRSSIIGTEYSEHTNSFHVSNKSSDRSVLATQKYGSHNMNAYDVFEHILNLQEPKIYKTVEVPDGMGDTKEKRVVDIDATRVIQRKADDIRKAFKDWIFRDPERREVIVNRYNELFNSIRPREYDGSHLSFPLMTKDIKLHGHQKNAIAHAMFGGNTLFAHAVGAGKTYEMIATAMESKRLGLCTKSLFAVPNHLTEQIGSDFQKLYPSANVLVATKKDFQKANRQQLFAKIATGNYDAVVIGHSQLGMIPISKERQIMTIQAQIEGILEGIKELKEKKDCSRFQIKTMERTRKSLQSQLDKLQKMNQDDTLTFEQLGVDRLFVDEAHEFKNMFVATKLHNVSGISNSASQKALDLFLKCRYLDEKTGEKGVIFATGTPYASPYQH
ncbi:YodL domain-containing protein [Ruminococcus albus]|uniref:YodL domain-containing protein n=1 Tax=Ruminococcus albus TaxID=1264 RepID=UPI000466B025|nr:YodL domain-containing protein [Ruminococcus albus]